jgi:adenine phosphoribosyltransferase
MLIDDLLATGGTMAAAVHLVRYLGGVVKEAVFVTELGDLGGRAKLEALDVPVRALVTY